MIMNDNLRMMNARLGNIDTPAKPPSTVEGVNDLARRINTMGGFPQQDRMIRDKYRTLLRALKSSYQGAWVKKYYPQETGSVISRTRIFRRVIITAIILLLRSLH